VSDDVTVLPESVDELLRIVGVFLGGCAFIRDDGAPNNLRQFVEELLAARPRIGILSKPENYVSWVEAVVRGAKDAVQAAPSASTPDVIADYGMLVITIWQALERVAEIQPDGRDFLLIVHPLDAAVEAGNEQRARALWNALERTLLRALGTATRDHVDTILFEMRNWPKQLGAQLLMPAVETIHARVESLTATELSAEPSKGNGWLGVLAYATEMLGAVASATDCTEAMRNRVFEILQVWAQRGCRQAIEVAQRIRSGRT
jgi:hypothetical protein